MSAARGRSEWVLAALVVAIVFMMIVPLPTVLIDVLIAANLTLGILLLAAALYMRDALSFAAFPTLILIATLYRLALNVSSTRLILLQADAGRIIEAFGQFVVRGDYAVGALVFVILTLIQFIVIAKGAERVAEVGARFTLDALPGKQLAIDAELRAGTMSPDKARTARRRLERESQLYGAMDGAMKFVKGDAIAGIVITAINFLGGVAIGIMGRGLEAKTSLSTYGLLTIGDGLVTQIPALLSATSAGLVVTRVASDRADASLAHDIRDQLFGDPRVLVSGAGLLCLLALIPGLPAWPFALMGGACATLFVRANRTKTVSPGALVATNELQLALGTGLANELLSGGEPRPVLASALDKAREQLDHSLGITLPDLRVTRDPKLDARSYRFVLRGLPESAVSSKGSGRELADELGETLANVGRKRADELLRIEDVRRMLDVLSAACPTLVRLTVPEIVTLPVLTDVLRNLLAEGVSVRWLDEVLEAVSTSAPTERDVDQLTELVRRKLARRICHDLSPQGALHLIRLSPEIEEALRDGVRNHAQRTILALPPDLAADIKQAIRTSAESSPSPNALVVEETLRRHVRELIRESLCDLPVLAPAEIPRTLEVLSTRVVRP